MMDRTSFVYILASQKKGTLYVGVTSDLASRVAQHKDKVADGFAKRYGVSRLVHYETFDPIEDAIAREKSLKRWRRIWKIALIERANPDGRDLDPDLFRG